MLNRSTDEQKPQRDILAGFPEEAVAVLNEFQAKGLSIIAKL